MAGKFCALSYVADTDAVLPPVAPFPLNAIVYVFAVLVKFAFTVVAPVIVPLADDQLENFVVYPVIFFTLAVAFLPSFSVSVAPLVEYVVLLFGTIKLVGLTLP